MILFRVQQSGTHRPLQLQFKETLLLLKLAAGLGILKTVLVLEHADARVRKISVQISEEGLGHQAVYQRAGCETVRVKLKVQGRSQEVGEARNVECLREASVSEESYPKREATRAAPAGLPKSFWSSHFCCEC